MERSALGERFANGDLEAEVVRLDGVDVRVATPARLWRMKRDTARAVDAGAERERALRSRMRRVAGER